MKFIFNSMVKLTIQIDKRNFEESLRKSLEEKLDTALNDIADFIGSESDRILRDPEEGSFDTGFLANSLVVAKEEKLHKEVGFGAMYATFIEFGTSPHFPPLDVIYQWLWRKRNDLGLKVDNKKTTKLNGKTYISGILNVAWAIAKKMSEKGTEEHPFLRPSFNLGKSKSGEFLKKAMKK